MHELKLTITSGLSALERPLAKPFDSWTKVNGDIRLFIRDRSAWEEKRDREFQSFKQSIDDFKSGIEQLASEVRKEIEKL
jgi:hypothetical protein